MTDRADLGAFDVADWALDEEHPFFPEGSRDKRLLRCPPDVAHPALIPGHRYLFKKSRKTYPDQFWAEVVAYHVGELCCVKVPPAFPAWDSRTGECAALIEWFYGYPDKPSESFLSGGLFMKAIIKDYDLKRGRQHNFGSIESWCRMLSSAKAQDTRLSLDEDWPEAWAGMLTFDALIGNTDRHHENWGFLVFRSDSSMQAAFSLAPAFDNGTSLGHERPPDQFGRFAEASYLNRYIRHGRHHMKWHAGDAQQAGHADLLLKLAEKYPQARPAMDLVLRFDPGELEQSLTALAALRVPVALSMERAGFMLRLILARREYLVHALTSPCQASQ